MDKDISTELQRIMSEPFVLAERERCYWLAKNGCLVPPDGGSPTEDEAYMCDRIADAIRNP